MLKKDGGFLMAKKKIAKYTKEMDKKAWAEWDKDKELAKYSIFQNVKFVLKIAWKECRVFLIVFAVITLCTCAETIIMPFFNKTIVDIVTSENDRTSVIILALSLLIATTVMFVISGACNLYLKNGGYFELNCNFVKKLLQKQLRIDYENLENPKVSDLLSKALGGADFISSNTIEVLSKTVSSIILIFTFGGILSMLHPILILIVAVPTVTCYYINRHKNMWIWNVKTPAVQKIDRKLSYLNEKIKDFSVAKDVRIFNMKKWFDKRYKIVLDERMDWWQQEDEWCFQWDSLIAVVGVIADLGAYSFTIYQVFKGNIGASEFILYFNSVTQFSRAVRNWCDNYSAYQWLSNNIGFTRAYLEVPEIANFGEGKPVPTETPEIEFKNVSYTYNGATEPTIKDISFKLHKGEKLAIVGLNGAGKTTLIKLMCGLYNATKGEITLNGTPINEFNREEYFRTFSAVFQDFTILPISVERNITLDKNIKNADASEKLVDVLKKSGLYEKVSELPKKEKTLLLKTIYEDGVDFSGGEYQKLALARAIYKNSPVLLLDEPTSALDPIAEQEMYLKYAEFTKSKSSVFISHRLASTRFCDRILLIDDGKIAENGSHEELMANNKKYAELWGLQSSYYNNDGGECYE